MRTLDRGMIVAETKEFLVVRKPAGLAVQSGKAGEMDLEHLLMNELAGRMQGRGRTLPYLAVVHRLDQPVEGLLVFARSKQAAAELSRQMQAQQMEKEYLAVTNGVPALRKGLLTDALVRDGRTNTSHVAGIGARGAKQAVLEYECLEEQNGRALLRIHLMTGRHHQIRVQLAHAGMPVVGDRKYAPDCRGEGAYAERTAYLALCAVRLSFRHPTTGKRLEYCVRPEGEYFREFGCSSLTEK